jgi:hypothetical protein
MTSCGSNTGLSNVGPFARIESVMVQGAIRADHGGGRIRRRLD